MLQEFDYVSLLVLHDLFFFQQPFIFLHEDAGVLIRNYFHMVHSC